MPRPARAGAGEAAARFLSERPASDERRRPPPRL